MMKKEETKRIVREGYAKVAMQGNSCCGHVDSCCGTADRAGDISKKIGYSDDCSPDEFKGMSEMMKKCFSGENTSFDCSVRKESMKKEDCCASKTEKTETGCCG